MLAGDPADRAGLFVAAADVDGDGRADVIAGSGGGTPMLRVFSGATGAPLHARVLDASFAGGVRVAAGDVNGDGFADVIAGTGPGVEARVIVHNGASADVLYTLTPYREATFGPVYRGGVHVAAGDVNGDGFADVITGPDEASEPQVRAFSGRTGLLLRSFFADEVTVAGGVRVAAGDVSGDGRADIITALGPGAAPRARVFDAATGDRLSEISPYEPAFTGGVYVATASPENRMVIDMPAADAVVRPAFRLAGWAFEEQSASGTGIDAIHVWAHPVGGGSPTFLGAATLGGRRPDIAAIFGERFAAAGFTLDVSGLGEGTYDVVAYGRSATTGLFNARRTVRVTVRVPVADVRVQVDIPAHGAAVRRRFRLGGWALDTASTDGSGIETIDVWAYPRSGGPPAFLGAATLGVTRPDVAAAFGAQFGAAGYHLDIAGLADGTYDLAVFARAVGQPSFAPARIVTVTVATPSPRLWLAVDLPTSGLQTSASFRVAGWAAMEGSDTPPAIDAVHVWAYPAGSGRPVFLGAATLGLERPDVAAFFGDSAYLASGFNVNATLPSGTWDVAVFAKPAGAAAFAEARVVRITIP